jgi:hypothetical protein
MHYSKKREFNRRENGRKRKIKMENTEKKDKNSLYG